MKKLSSLIFILLCLALVCDASPVRIVRSFTTKWNAENDYSGKGVKVTVTLSETTKRPRDAFLSLSYMDPSASITIDPTGYNFSRDIEIDVSGARSSFSKSPYEVFYLHLRSAGEYGIVCELLDFAGDVVETYEVQLK